MNDQLPAWMQAGSVAVFAAVVWWEQRSIRRSIEGVQLMLAALLGPDRVAKLTRRGGRALTPPPIENDHDSQ